MNLAAQAAAIVTRLEHLLAPCVLARMLRCLFLAILAVLVVDVAPAGAATVSLETRYFIVDKGGTRDYYMAAHLGGDADADRVLKLRQPRAGRRLRLYAAAVRSPVWVCRVAIVVRGPQGIVARGIHRLRLPALLDFGPAALSPRRRYHVEARSAPCGPRAHLRLAARWLLPL